MEDKQKKEEQLLLQ